MTKLLEGSMGSLNAPDRTPNVDAVNILQIFFVYQDFLMVLMFGLEMLKI